MPDSMSTQVRAEPRPLSESSRALVKATANDDEWRDVLDTYGVVAVTSTLKRVLADLGDQEQHRLYGLSDLRTDPSVTDAQYDTAQRHHALWKRSVATIKQRVRKRLAEVQPQAQALHDEHQSDRRVLVILAKRIFLWEEGLEDRLEDALDDFTISVTAGDPTAGRMTLRQLIEEIVEQGPVTP